MFNSLFKPAWQSTSKDKRLNFIEKSDTKETDYGDILSTLAESDTDEVVRHAALEKLNDPALCFKLSTNHPDLATRNFAYALFLQLAGPKSKLSVNEFEQLLIAKPKTRSLIQKLCPHSSLRSKLINELNENEQARIIADIEYSDTRIEIAERLQSTEALVIARQKLKGKDKTSEKIIKAKIETIHAEQRKKEERLESAEKLYAHIDYLATHTEWRGEFNQQFQLHKQRWDELNFSADKNLILLFNKAATRAEERMQQYNQITLATKERNEAVKNLDKSCREISSLSLEELIKQSKKLKENQDSYLENWSTYSKLLTPNRELAKNLTNSKVALSSALDFAKTLSKLTSEDIETKDTKNTKEIISAYKNALATLAWPNHYPNLNAKTEAQTKLDELITEEKAKQKLADGQLDKLHKRVNRLLGSSKRGELNRAKRELAAVTKAAERYSGKERTILNERLQKADDMVQKMADWKDFATEPKYIELCESMEKLVTSKTNSGKKKYDKLAKEIAELQTRWKALDHSDSADKHWERFKTASDKAYQPCAEFFQQRSKTQKQNLEKRGVILTQARTLLSDTAWDEKPDYKSIESQLRSISNDWQKIKNVERRSGERQWKKFKKTKDEIYAKLDVEYQSNIDDKNSLIEKANAMLEVDAKEDTLKKLQYLQKQWKEIGITRRKDDQKAWKKFKSATDAVYEKIQGVRKAKRAEEDEKLNAYRNISKAINKLAKDTNDLSTADTEFEKLQADYSGLPDLPEHLPEKLIKGIRSDYRKACDFFNKSRERIIRTNKNKVYDHLETKATLCTELEALPANADDESINEIQNKISEITISDKSIQRRFDKRLKTARNADKQAATEKRHRLCIELEILLGVESPAEDKSLRMQMQLERMQSGGFGQASEDKQTKINEYKLDWYCLPGAEAKIQKELNQRFKRLIK